MKNMKNTLVLVALMAGGAWTNVAKPAKAVDTQVTKLIDKLKAQKVKLEKKAKEWLDTCNKKHPKEKAFQFIPRSICVGANYTTRIATVKFLDQAIKLGIKVGDAARATLESALKAAKQAAK